MSDEPQEQSDHVAGSAPGLLMPFGWPEVIILAVALLVRLGVAGVALRDPSVPRCSDDYIGMALRSPRPIAFEAAERPPLYPFLCRVLLWTLGPRSVVHGVVLLQVAAGVGSVWLLLRCAWLMGLRRREGLLGGALLALDPMSVVYSALVLTETLYVFLLLGAVHLVLVLRRPQPLRRARRLSVTAGLSVLAAGLMRYVGLPTAFAIGFWSLLTPGDLPAKTRRVAALALLGTLAAGALAWAFANWMTFGHFALASSNGHNFASMWVGPARVRSEGRAEVSLLDSLNCWTPAEVGPEYYSADAFVQGDAYGRAALRWALAHPDAMLSELMRSGTLFWLGPGEGPWQKITGLNRLPHGAVAALFLWRLFLLGAASVGAIASWDRSPGTRQALALVLLVVGMHWLAVGCGGFNRYAVPVQPFLCLLTGLGLIEAVRRLREISWESEPE